MIIRLSQKLAKKLKLGTLPALPPDENPYADWSANLFTADRTQYIILTNTRSLYSVVMYGKGITDDSRFIVRALDNIREFMEGDGQAFAYGDPELIDQGFDDLHCIDSTVTPISEIVPKDGKRYGFLYEYDFGDCWQHEVLFEGCLRAAKGERYPRCIEGERACPPEDVGGIRCYAEFLVALADPEHERHDEYMEWNGPFDSEKSNAEKATKRMRRGLPDWRSEKWI